MDSPLTTRVALLQALREGPGYGKDLIRRVARMTSGAMRLSPARVYPCLQTLAREGLATARTVTPGRSRGARARRYYELTPLGVEASAVQRNILRRIAEGSGPPRSCVDEHLMARRLLAADELSMSARLLRTRLLRSQVHGSR
ncbi:MAG: PadR family transcriptional regulator [Vicinamibacteria bacterium]